MRDIERRIGGWSDPERSTRPCKFDATRTSPFGHYATCQCGWVSGGYSDTADGAWKTWLEHRQVVTWS